MSNGGDAERSYADYRRQRAEGEWRRMMEDRYDATFGPEGLTPNEVAQRTGIAPAGRQIPWMPHRQALEERAAEQEIMRERPAQPPGAMLGPETVVPAVAQAAPALAKGVLKGPTDLPADTLGAVQDVVNWATGSHGEWAEKFRLFEKSTDPVEQMSRGAAAFLLSFASIAGALSKVGTGIKVAKEFPALVRSASTLGGAFGASFTTKQGGLSFHAAEWAKGQMPEQFRQQLEASLAFLPVPVREALDWVATQDPDDEAVEQRFKMALTNVVDTVLIVKLFQVGKFLAKAGPTVMESGGPGAVFPPKLSVGQLGGTPAGGIGAVLIQEGYREGGKMKWANIAVRYTLEEAKADAKRMAAESGNPHRVYMGREHFVAPQGEKEILLRSYDERLRRAHSFPAVTRPVEDLPMAAE